MKKIKYSIKTLLAFFSSERLILIIIIFAMVICNVVFLLFTNQFYNDKLQASNMESIQNKMEFQFADFNKNDYLDFLNLTRQYGVIRNIIVSTSATEDSSIQLCAYDNLYEIGDRQITMGELLSSNSDMTHFIGSEKLNLYLLSQYGQNLTNGYKLTLNDYIVSCKGIVATNEFDVLVSTDLFFNIKPKNLSITYLFAAGTSQFELEELNNKIIDGFSPDNVIRPNIVFQYSFLNFLQNAKVIILYLLIAIMNYSFVYMYLIKKRLKVYGILKLYGLSNKKYFAILCGELLSIFSIVFLFSFVIYYFFCMFIGYDYPCVVTQFSFSFLVMLLLNIVIFFPIVILNVIKTPIKQYKGSMTE